ncbi:hypothetical protein RCL1_005246 [Eukaryota sp. TZLM3-RCL]
MQQKYHDPRMTMGSFTLCLRTLFTQQTGRELVFTQFGKPTVDHFNYAASVLKKLGATRFVMVDDNPVSGIRGANQFEEWTSVLVLTGIAQENCKQDPADFVFNDISECVDYFLSNL